MFPAYRRPDEPLRPHRAHSRAELLVSSPKVLITPEAYKRMCLYVAIAPKEVGWLGTVSQTPTGNFLIEQVFLLEQEVTGVETELNPAGQEKLVLDLLEKGDEGFEQANRLRFWGHSHVRMSTSPSPQDENTAMQFGTKQGHPWHVRGIFTKDGRAEFTVYFFDKGFRIIDAPWAVWDPIEGMILESPRFSPYYGGYAPPGEREQGSGSFFDTWQGPTAISKNLPAKLVPDETLRAEVVLEYAIKVTERQPRMFFKWPPSFGKDTDNRVDDGDCIPVGADVQEPRAQPEGSQVGGLTGEISTSGDRNAQNKNEGGGGFFSWLCGLLAPSEPARGVKPPTDPRGHRHAQPDNPTATPTSILPEQHPKAPDAPSGKSPGAGEHLSCP